jgi:hypothetical protein
MGRFYESQLKRFKLLGSKSKSEQPEIKMDPIPEPSEIDRKLASEQSKREQRMQQYSSIFAKMGNEQPGYMQTDQRLVDTDDDILLAGIKSFESY